MIKRLSDEAKSKLANDYPLLDFSFEDDYKEEVALLLQAQLEDVLRQVVELLESPMSLTKILFELKKQAEGQVDG